MSRAGVPVFTLARFRTLPSTFRRGDTITSEYRIRCGCASWRYGACYACSVVMPFFCCFTHRFNSLLNAKLSWQVWWRESLPLIGGFVWRKMHNWYCFTGRSVEGFQDVKYLHLFNPAASQFRLTSSLPSLWILILSLFHFVYGASCC